MRPAWAEIDLGAITHNARVLASLAAPSALCAVVKADGYGHGAAAVAQAAVRGGASWLAVALVDEGLELRHAGVTQPILVLSEPVGDAYGEMVNAGLTPTVYSLEGVRQAAAAAVAASQVVGVHLKVDTGMHRVGAPPSEVMNVAEAIAASPALELAALWTHLPVADTNGADDLAFTAGQLDRFDAIVSSFDATGQRPPLVHAANSAGAISWARARYDLVRCGIALYGHPPTDDVAAALDTLGAPPLRPALTLKARVTHVADLASGDRPSYGRLRALAHDALVATIPIGYADGVARQLFARGHEVLIRGQRFPLAGMVTMDQIMVDCGADSAVAVGDEVVLLGRQGDEEIGAAEWAEHLDTITYEVLCGIGSRVPRLSIEEATP